MGSAKVTTSRQSTTPQPRYLAVKRYVLGKIEGSEWQSGALVPSESNLAAQFGVARMTVNRAIRELTAEGYLTRLQGVGTFVAKPRHQAPLLEIHNIAHEIAARGGHHHSQVIECREERADDTVADALAIEPRARVYHVVLIHFEDGRPIQLEDRYVNPETAPGFIKQNFARITPSQYLLDHVPLVEVEHKIEAKLPTPQERQLLQLDANEACLVLWRRTWADGRIVTRARFVYPGDGYNIAGRFRPEGPTLAVVA